MLQSRSLSCGFRSHLTLALCTILHAFTHAYGTALVPLYLLIVADLKLGGVGAAAVVVTIYGLVYNVGSYAAGVLADRFDRHVLLSIGLMGNALAITAMGLTRQYEMLIVLGVVAGMFGTLFHPCANALIPAHYPKSPGMAIGILGMGSGIGFFAGPQYAGWRAQSATWHFGLTADWQRPCIEMGIAGIVIGIVFLFFGNDPRKKGQKAEGRGQQKENDDITSALCPHPSALDEDAMLPARISVEAIVTELRGEHAQHTPHLTWPMRRLLIGIAFVLGWRDFAATASLTLLSVYLQKAHQYSTKQAGFVIGGMMLIGVLSNPLAVYLSPGKRRLPALAAVLILGGFVLFPVPMLPVAWVLPVMCLFQCFQLGSYAMSDAAMLERVSPMVRGRVVGLFLTLAGTFAGLAPSIIGYWTDHLKQRAQQPMSYMPLFATLGVMMIFASASTSLIAKLTAASTPAAVAAIPE